MATIPQAPTLSPPDQELPAPSVAQQPPITASPQTQEIREQAPPWGQPPPTLPIPSPQSTLKPSGFRRLKPWQWALSGLSVLLVVGVIVAGAFMLGGRTSTPAAKPKATSIPSNMQLHTDNQAHFQMLLPKGWTATGSAVSTEGLLVESPDKASAIAVVTVLGTDMSDKVVLLDEVFSTDFGIGAVITNKVAPSDVSLAGETWIRESVDVTVDGETMHMVGLATTHAGSTYAIFYGAAPPSRFAAANTTYFQPAVESFKFLPAPTPPAGSTPTVAAVQAGFVTYLDTQSHIQMLLPASWGKTGTPAGNAGMWAESPDRNASIYVAAGMGWATPDKVATLEQNLALGYGELVVIQNKSAVTEVTFAGQTWVQESAEVRAQDGTQWHEVGFVTVHDGSTYLLYFDATPPSAFADFGSRYFTPVVQSFQFTHTG